MRYDPDSDSRADYEAEMAADMPEMTDAEWEEFELAQQAAADVAAEAHAERALSFGYGS